ncbi:hypothetical protein ACHAW6_009259 [Cyclotella cf. meneghiniana]
MSSSSSQSSKDDDKRSNAPRTPSFLQRISSFIDSPCSSYLGIPSSLICASPRSDPTTTARSSSVPVEHRNVVTPIATPDKKAEPISSRRRIQNRSSAPRPIRRRRLDELVNTATIGPRPSSDAVTYAAASSHLSPRSTLRRVRSLQAVSPSSVAAADSSFWAEAADGIDCGPVRDCCPDDRSPIDGGLLSSVGNWCCYDIIAAAATFDNSNRVAPSVQDKCNGYVDYAGVHHPHTDNNCQGCIFRQSLFDGSDLIPSAEDLYYDSDCGDIMNQSRRFQIRDGSTSKARRDNRTSYPPEDFTQRRRMLAVRDPSPERRAHLYDYFMRDVNHRIATPLRTGVCATSERDIGDCVQEALNSTWTLSWHTPPTTSHSSSSLPFQTKLCNVWIERGYRRNHNQAVEPRLMWREVRPALHDAASAHPSRYSVELNRPYSLSLLAIRRIVAPDGIESCPPVFAKPDCMLIVRSSLARDYYFEASGAEERDRTIHLWKMTTARLVSFAVMGNSESMAKEFFNEYSVH